MTKPHTPDPDKKALTLELYRRHAIMPAFEGLATSVYANLPIDLGRPWFSGLSSGPVIIDFTLLGVNTLSNIFITLLNLIDSRYTVDTYSRYLKYIHLFKRGIDGIAPYLISSHLYFFMISAIASAIQCGDLSLPECEESPDGQISNWAIAAMIVIVQTLSLPAFVSATGFYGQLHKLLVPLNAHPQNQANIDRFLKTLRFIGDASLNTGIVFGLTYGTITLLPLIPFPANTVSNTLIHIQENDSARDAFLKLKLGPLIVSLVAGVTSSSITNFGARNIGKKLTLPIAVIALLILDAIQMFNIENSTRDEHDNVFFAIRILLWTRLIVAAANVIISLLNPIFLHGVRGTFFASENELARYKEQPLTANTPNAENFKNYRNVEKPWTLGSLLSTCYAAICSRKGDDLYDEEFHTSLLVGDGIESNILDERNHKDHVLDI